jgi:acetoin utilization deacetylase AcuC-like enzyme
MRAGYDETCLGHDTGGRHPEHADRLRALREALERRHAVRFETPSPATIDDLATVHDREYLEELRSFCAEGGGNWDADTVAVEATWDAVLASAGAACWAAREALSCAPGSKTPFSLGRPPGHHADTDDAMGFCFANNVAVGAEDALSSDGVDRVAILDWDVHHGNGTQDIFAERGDVFFASVHEAGLYPGTGVVEDVGDGAGRGATLNVPLTAGAGDPDYDLALSEVVLPAIETFDPDLFLVSAGFDAHRHDPISRMSVSTDGFGHLTRLVADAATAVDAGLGFVLEGGYGLETLADSVLAVHDALATGDAPTPEGEPIAETRSVLEDVQSVRQGLGEK